MNPEIIACLAIAGYAVIALGLVVHQIRRNEAGWRAWALYAVQRLYSGLVFQWRSNRRSPLPAQGPALVIANHRSPVDPLMVWTNHHLRDGDDRPRVIGFIMAREYYEKPIVNWICRSAWSIPADRNGRDMAATREAMRRLKNGQLVGIFPEGRINMGEGLLEGNPGVAWLALTTKVPVYPVFIHNAPQGAGMVDPFCTFCRVRVTYGDPIDLSQYYGQRKTPEVLSEVTTLLMSQLAALGEEGKEHEHSDDIGGALLQLAGSLS